jgi:hypothetical protein
MTAVFDGLAFAKQNDLVRYRDSDYCALLLLLLLLVAVPVGQCLLHDFFLRLVRK